MSALAKLQQDTRTGHAHQVSTLALAKFQQDTRAEHAHQVSALAKLPARCPCKLRSHNKVIKRCEREKRVEKNPTYQYWGHHSQHGTPQTHLCQSSPTARFPSLLCIGMEALVPQFTLDMEDNLPGPIFNEFVEHGHWVVPPNNNNNRFSTTRNRFSKTSLDHMSRIMKQSKVLEV